MDEWYKPENHFFGKELLVAQAIEYNDGREIKKLIKKYGIDVNFIGKTGYSFLFYSVRVQKKKAMKVLLELGADPNLPSNFLAHPRFRGHNPYEIQYPIFLATYYSDLSYIKILLEYRVNPNVLSTGAKVSPLHNTVINGKEDKNIEIINVLLDGGADINIQDAIQQTPLHTAAKVIGIGNGREVFLHLLERGADPNIPDKYGESPAYLIQEKLQSFEADGYRIPMLESMIEALKAKGVVFPVEKVKMPEKMEESPAENKKENEPQASNPVVHQSVSKRSRTLLDEDDGIIIG
jgi:ankyrin repeat protein